MTLVGYDILRDYQEDIERIEDELESKSSDVDKTVFGTVVDPKLEKRYIFQDGAISTERGESYVLAGPKEILEQTIPDDILERHSERKS